MSEMMLGGSRRDFLKGTAWMGLAAAAAGCQFEKMGFKDISGAEPQQTIGQSKEG